MVQKYMMSVYGPPIVFLTPQLLYGAGREFPMVQKDMIWTLRCADITTTLSTVVCETLPTLPLHNLHHHQTYNTTYFSVEEFYQFAQSHNNHHHSHVHQRPTQITTGALALSAAAPPVDAGARS